MGDPHEVNRIILAPHHSFASSAVAVKPVVQFIHNAAQAGLLAGFFSFGPIACSGCHH
jgi:hypothetical protein